MVSDGLFKLPNEFRHFEATEVPPTPLRYRRVVEWFELEETPKDRLFTLPAVHRELDRMTFKHSIHLKTFYEPNLGTGSVLLVTSRAVLKVGQHSACSLAGSCSEKPTFMPI